MQENKNCHKYLLQYLISNCYVFNKIEDITLVGEHYLLKFDKSCDILKIIKCLHFEANLLNYFIEDDILYANISIPKYKLYLSKLIDKTGVKFVSKDMLLDYISFSISKKRTPATRESGRGLFFLFIFTSMHDLMFHIIQFCF